MLAGQMRDDVHGRRVFCLLFGWLVFQVFVKSIGKKDTGILSNKNHFVYVVIPLIRFVSRANMALKRTMSGQLGSVLVHPLFISDTSG